MIVSLIVAMDENGGIGKKKRLPWYLPSDLRRFRQLTMGHHLVMGRKTFETIGKPLPGRVMIIVTRNRGFFFKDCLVVNSLEAALQLADVHNETEVFIIGGGDIFEQSIDLADKIYLTTVHDKLDTDIFFPKINISEWQLIIDEEVIPNERDEYKSDFKIYIRKSGDEG